MRKPVFGVSDQVQHKQQKMVKGLKFHLSMSRIMRKPTICICQNKDAGQLRGNPEADQHLYFRYTDSTIPLLPKSKISSL